MSDGRRDMWGRGKIPTEPDAWVNIYSDGERFFPRTRRDADALGTEMSAEQKTETWPQTEDRLVREIGDGSKTIREGVKEAREKTIQEVRVREQAASYPRCPQ